MDGAYSYGVSIFHKTRNCLGLRHFDCLFEEKIHEYTPSTAPLLSVSFFPLGAFAKSRKKANISTLRTGDADLRF